MLTLPLMLQAESQSSRGTNVCPPVARNTTLDEAITTSPKLLMLSGIRKQSSNSFVWNVKIRLMQPDFLLSSSPALIADLETVPVRILLNRDAPTAEDK